MSVTSKTPYDKLRSVFRTKYMTLENEPQFRSLRERVFRDSIYEINQNLNLPYQIALCYMNRLAIRADGEVLVPGRRSLGNVIFPNEFVEMLSPNQFIIPKDGKVLRGYPFVSSLDINQKILNSFKELGALWIGRDVTGTVSPLTSELNTDCMYFVAQKYSAFAVIQNIQLSMLQSAERHNLYTVTYYYAPTCFFHYRVTIAVRNLSDLETVHPPIAPRIVCCGPRRFRQGIPLVVISLGFKGFKIDGFLFKLAQKLSEAQNQVQEYRICYYFGTSCENNLSTIQGYFDDPHNQTNYQNAVSAMSNEAILDMSKISEEWSFSLTQIDKTLNILENVGEDYLITIPVPEAGHYSMQLVRHPCVKGTIRNFATAVASKTEEVVTDGWF